MKTLFIELTAIAIAVVAIGLDSIAATPQRVYHDDCCNHTDSMVMISLPDCPFRTKALEIRGTCAPEGRKSADRHSSFGIAWGISDDPSAPYYRVMLSPATTDNYDGITDRPAVTLVIERIEPAENVTATLSRHLLSDGFELLRCENSLAVEIDCRSMKATVFAGNRQLAEIDTAPAPVSGAFAVITRAKASVRLIVSETVADYAALLHTGWTPETLHNALSDPCRIAPQGIWNYLDRDNDSRYCRLGGDYRIAIIDDGHGGFDIIYLDGARTGAAGWTPGMRKGHLHPTPFKNHYDLVWYDASMNAIQCEASATMEQDAILRFDFPLLKSSVRFARVADINSALPDK